jgi:hypothetical protein
MPSLPVRNAVKLLYNFILRIAYQGNQDNVNTGAGGHRASRRSYGPGFP